MLKRDDIIQKIELVLNDPDYLSSIMPYITKWRNILTQIIIAFKENADFPEAELKKIITDVDVNSDDFWAAALYYTFYLLIQSSLPSYTVVWKGDDLH